MLSCSLSMLWYSLMTRSAISRLSNLAEVSSDIRSDILKDSPGEADLLADT